MVDSSGLAASSSHAGARAPRFAFPALVAGNVVLAFGPALVRLSDVGPVAAGFWRLFLALPFLLFLSRREWARERLRPALRLLIGLAGLFFAADLASWHIGIHYTKVANATIFGNVSSVLLPLWALVVLRHRPSGLQVAALACAAAGIAVMMGGSYEASPRYLRGDLLCLLAGMLYTGYILSVQNARAVLGSWAILALSTAAGILPLLAFALLLGEQVIPGNWAPVAILALSSQVVGQGLLVYSMAWFSPLVVGLTLLAQPAVAAMTGWLLFGERVTATDALGALAIAAALILVRWPGRA